MQATRDGGRHQLRGPLDGIPIILKDNVGTRDAPTTAGSIAFKGNIPKHEATIVAKLRVGRRGDPRQDQPV